MYRLRIGRDAEEGRDGVEGDAVDFSGVGTSTEFVHFVPVWKGEDADDGAFVRSGCKEGAGGVEREVRDGGFVRLDDVGHGEGDGVEDEDVASGLRRGVRGGSWWGRGEGSRGGGKGGRVREVAVL